jgi:predicted RNA-binding Zn-ribbon protein involved in translation (DUF1610 family)
MDKDKAMNEMIEKASIIAHNEGLGKDKPGFFHFECLMCEYGIVNCEVAALNGHIHGQCDTCGFMWME